ncbi:acyl-CoA N-acyltransferase [Cladorrhinum sp. PSN259]|nr:acyl-CoA N-acyltransferase [Cladorrhinum sp. PSN259]
MAPHTIYLPDGQSINVTPVFAGLFFKSNVLTTHDHGFPAGWTIVIHTEDTATRDSEDDEVTRKETDNTQAREDDDNLPPEKKTLIHTFTQPTLTNDSLFISSISNPSSRDFKPAASPTRQVAMMLWVTLYWYFNQPAPSNTLTTEASKLTPLSGRPRGDWRVRIKRDGVLRGRNLIPKLERMGLIASYNSAVGVSLEDTDDMWSSMFVSQRMFWQIPGRLFLFTLQPTEQYNLSHTASPTGSRPGSPLLAHENISNHQIAEISDLPGAPPPTTLAHMPSFPIGPFFSASHLPTYYPPAPLQYTLTNHIRHPLRPRPPRMGEIFYTRFISSVGQYLSFRVASISPRAVPYLGPIGPNPQLRPNLCNMNDSALLQQWFGNPRVSAFWGEYPPTMLSTALQSRHSFPVIGMWDGVPFGYFELYWVKEDILGRYAGGSAIDDFDRGLHVLIGEEWARGRVQSWLTSLVHWAFCADNRTMSVCLEPRVDNARFIQHLEYAGFTKEKEITFPHKQAWFGRLRRENWEGPAM